MNSDEASFALLIAKSSFNHVTSPKEGRKQAEAQESQKARAPSGFEDVKMEMNESWMEKNQ